MERVGDAPEAEFEGVGADLAKVDETDVDVEGEDAAGGDTAGTDAATADLANADVGMPRVGATFGRGTSTGIGPVENSPAKLSPNPPQSDVVLADLPRPLPAMTAAASPR